MTDRTSVDLGIPLQVPAADGNLPVLAEHERRSLRRAGRDAGRASSSGMRSTKTWTTGSARGPDDHVLDDVQHADPGEVPWGSRSGRVPRP